MSSSSIDPFIGVDEPGNCLCGPFLPHGLVRLGPDTLPPQSTSGYQSHRPIVGFSHTHVSGTGGHSRYGNILVTPFLGPARLNAGIFERKDEHAAAGYYSVVLTPGDISVELTTTPRVGVHRYRFPAESAANLLFDTGAVIQTWHCTPTVSSGGCVGGFVEFLSSRELVGRGDLKGGWGHDFPYSVYFYARWNLPVREMLVGNSLGLLSGQTASGIGARAICHFGTEVSQIDLVVGISFISVAKARASVEREVGRASFDQVRNDAGDIWERETSRLKVEGGSSEQRKLFYTSLYRLRCMPGDLGVDDEFPSWQSGVRHFNDYYALWDSVRNANALLTLLDPELEVGMLNCLLDIAEHTGWLPDAWIAGHSAQVQGGSSADVLFCEAALKGLAGIDYEQALRWMRKNAEVESPNPHLHGRYLSDYRDLGYVSNAVPTACVSRHLEYAYQDWCIGTLAKCLGHDEVAREYVAGSRKVWNLWRDDLRFFAPRQRNGRWIDPFDPAHHIERRSYDPYFYEGTSWQWSFNVQHDFDGLVKRHGGTEMFAAHLDRFFDEGHFALKETMLHVPFLYLYAGRPDRTAERVRDALSQYKSTRTGLPDNEDMGCQSAFYICASMGLYPLMGQDIYWLTAPRFPSIAMELGRTGKVLTIEAEGDVQNEIYIREAWLNDKPLERFWIRHAELVGGGTLRFRLSKDPSDWGKCKPPHIL